MTSNTEAGVILRNLLHKLREDPKAIDWTHGYPLKSTRGRVSLDGVTLEVRGVDESGYMGGYVGVVACDQGIEISLVLPPPSGTGMELLVPLRAASRFDNWRVSRAARASFKAFKTHMRVCQQDANQKAIHDAVGRLGSGSNGARSREVSDPGAGLA